MNYNRSAIVLDIVSIIISIIFIILIIYSTGLFSCGENKLSSPPSVYVLAQKILQEHELNSPANKPTVSNNLNFSETHTSPLKVVFAQDNRKENKQNNFPHFAKMGQILQNEDQCEDFSKTILIAQRENCIHKIRRYTDVLRDMYKQKNNGPAKQNVNNLSSIQHLEQIINMLEKVLKDVIYRYEMLRGENAVRRIKIALREILVDRSRGFASLVGRKKLKNFICEQILSFARVPGIFNNSMQNITLLGNSGIGKTHLARVLAFAYCQAGIITRNSFVVGTSRDLVSQYVSETSHVTFGKLCETLESVYLIDEAYQLGIQNLYANGGQGHNREAVTELVNFLDKFKGCSIVIAAGYQKDMDEKFFTANEGLARRFPHRLLLDPYSIEELTAILIGQICEKSSNICIISSDEDRSYLRDIINILHKHDEDVREKQAGQMEIIAGHIVQHIMSSDYSWNNGPRKELLIGGINSYLYIKGSKFQIVMDSL